MLGGEMFAIPLILDTMVSERLTITETMKQEPFMKHSRHSLKSINVHSSSRESLVSIPAFPS